MENEQEQLEEETKPSRRWLNTILHFAVICFVGIAIVGVAVFITPFLFLEQLNESSYSEILQNCSAALVFYINQTPDYATWETQDEYDLKQLRYALLENAAVNCMETAWRER